jgi:hypothetical protein
LSPGTEACGSEAVRTLVTISNPQSVPVVVVSLAVISSCQTPQVKFMFLLCPGCTGEGEGEGRHLCRGNDRDLLVMVRTEQRSHKTVKETAV